MKTEIVTEKQKKQKKSILDPFYAEIKYYHDLGVTVPNIARIMNEKTPVKLDTSTYRYFIKNKLGI